ncbi:MAG: ribonuclease J [Candidatus Berkelbacteria bacterium]|nr:ribonuclease J [Candidatus Berkelbacteria bacterium]
MVKKFYPKLKIIPLGGLGEVGKNMMIYEYGQDIILVDCGIMFPGQEFLGIDFVIPNIDYLLANKHRIRGIIITHGHEDHTGGLPYIWPKLGVPIFATKLTAGLVDVKMKEFSIANPKIRLIKAGDILHLGVFKIEFFRVTHSIPDSVGLAIETPVGLFVHTGDFKFDKTPVFEDPTDLSKLAGYSRRGVLGLLSDSTNAEVPGYAISEQEVGKAIEGIFRATKGRLVITSFASLISRVQLVFNAAVKYRRKVAVAGFSMEKNIEMASRLGYLKIPQGVLQDIRKINHLPDNEVVILCTGSQGEEMSALVRMASGEHKQVKIKEGDTVLISASVIPGNERASYNTIDNLYRLGADCIYRKELGIHESGHAKVEDLKEMIKLIKPKYLIPIHGEYHMLIHLAQIGQEMGIPRERILVIENGQTIEFERGKGRISSDRVNASYVLVDGLGVGDIGQIVLRDRQVMAKDGIFVVILTIDKKTGRIITSPDIISRGFVYMRESEDLIQRARAEIKRMFSRHNNRYPLDLDYIKRSMRDEMGEFLYKNTERRPMVIPVIIEL